MGERPKILEVNTLRVIDNAEQLSVLPRQSAEVLRSSARLYHDLTQVLRLCVTEKFNPKTAGEDLLRVMARAGDAPDFSSLEERIKEAQTEVRRVFKAVVEGS
jgi:glutamate-ammonia-ligase adenylyltransferase